MEAWKTNVLGTLNVLEAARAVGVETFVNVSTDKAANPSCVLGYSKRMTERLTALRRRRTSGRYVRSASATSSARAARSITAFTAADRAGRPGDGDPPGRRALLHAHPRGLPARAAGRRHRPDGEVMVLDMGNPMKIVDVAKTLIEPVGPPRHRDRLHRSTARREDVRGALHPRRGESAPSSLVAASTSPLPDSEVVHASTPCLRRGVGGWMRRRSVPEVGHPPREQSCHDRADLPLQGRRDRARRSRVLDALRSGWIAPLGPPSMPSRPRSPSVRGCPGALALSSGTAALHLALIHLGARPGTVVLVLVA
jgi:hypothetical protein